MRFLGLHILTGKSLQKRLEQARAEQRRMDGKIVEKTIGDNVLLAAALRNRRASG